MSVVEQHRPEEPFNPHYRFCGFYPPLRKTTYANGWSALAGTRACQYRHYEMTRDTGLSDRQMLGARHWEFDPNHLPGFNIPLGLVDYPKVCWGAKVLYGYLAFPRLDGSADPDIESMAAVMAVSIGTIKHGLQSLSSTGSLGNTLCILGTSLPCHIPVF